MKLEFVSYTGRYPNLCNGELTVKISGKRVRFGNTVDTRFWITGGHCEWDGVNNSVHHGPWRLDDACVPGKYKAISQQLIELFNANVPHGCCGGCT